MALLPRIVWIGFANIKISTETKTTQTQAQAQAQNKDRSKKIETESESPQTQTAPNQSTRYSKILVGKAPVPKPLLLLVGCRIGYALFETRKILTISFCSIFIPCYSGLCRKIKIISVYHESCILYSVLVQALLLTPSGPSNR